MAVPLEILPVVSEWQSRRGPPWGMPQGAELKPLVRSDGIDPADFLPARIGS